MSLASSMAIAEVFKDVDKTKVCLPSNQPANLSCVAKEQKLFENLVYHQKWWADDKINAAKALRDLYESRGDASEVQRISDRILVLEGAVRVEKALLASNCDCSISYPANSHTLVTFSTGMTINIDAVDPLSEVIDGMPEGLAIGSAPLSVSTLMEYAAAEFFKNHGADYKVDEGFYRRTANFFSGTPTAMDQIAAAINAGTSAYAAAKGSSAATGTPANATLAGVSNSCKQDMGRSCNPQVPRCVYSPISTPPGCYCRDPQIPRDSSQVEGRDQIGACLVGR